MGTNRGRFARFTTVRLAHIMMKVGMSRLSRATPLYPSGPLRIRIGEYAVKFQKAIVANTRAKCERCRATLANALKSLAQIHANTTAPRNMPGTPKFKYHPVA